MKLFYLLLISLPLIALELKTFQANFKQTITDENNKTVVYEGTLLAKTPSSAKWIYTKPISKDVYVDEYQITVVEKDLEQAIIKDIDSTVDFIKLLQKAKRSNSNSYSTKIENKIYTLKYKNELPYTVEYKDFLENRVKITFINQIMNKEMNSSIFKPIIPLEYDVIVD
ncbi:MAG: LolA-like outer membrane lipoprotein chaperone [Campylobacterota bacterium]|nr:LolA-like outer membrane lipoprotein chaperone [Campylobacterota bacterium]